MEEESSKASGKQTQLHCEVYAHIFSQSSCLIKPHINRTWTRDAHHKYIDNLSPAQIKSREIKSCDAQENSDCHCT